jgi:hypothetical protein
MMTNNNNSSIIAETTVNLPQGSYLKYSNCNNELYNDFNYWKLPIPIDDIENIAEWYEDGESPYQKKESEPKN